MDLLPEDFGARRIYASDEVLAFVAAALEKDVLHRSADPLDGVNMTVYEQGDELGWHFDQSEFSVTLMIQRSQAGGEFEYAPMVRTPDDERYDAVRSVLIGETPAKKLASDPGHARVLPRPLLPPPGAAGRRLDAADELRAHVLGRARAHAERDGAAHVLRSHRTALTPRLTPHLRPSQAAFTGGA